MNSSAGLAIKLEHQMDSFSEDDVFENGAKYAELYNRNPASASYSF